MTKREAMIEAEVAWEMEIGDRPNKLTQYMGGWLGQHSLVTVLEAIRRAGATPQYETPEECLWSVKRQLKRCLRKRAEVAARDQA